MAPDEPLELFPTQAAGGPALPAPLAERMRPSSLDEVVGQQALIGPGAPLRILVESGALPSLLLWGPPGSGKTTLARLLAGPADAGGALFAPLSAVTAGLKEVRAAVAEAERARAGGRATVLFLDEIHRLNRAQQDALLPHVERGTVTLVGATTENPSFEVIAPLLSRCRVYALEPLEPGDLETLVRRALADRERGLGRARVEVSDAAVSAIAEGADGDARRALGWLEAAAALAERRGGPVDPETVAQVTGRRLLRHDRDREEHYNVVSALIKSLRASDPDAALYYAARMLEAGEDPRFLARRLVIFASEDVGNAEPAALPLAIAAYQAVERIGLPEARINLGQAVTFLACAPKSNASYRGIEAAAEAVRRTGSAPVPLHLRNAPTDLMRRHGYGEGYRYAHDEPDGFVPDRNLPEGVGEARFYEPRDSGAESAIRERLEAWRRRRGETPG